MRAFVFIMLFLMSCATSGDYHAQLKHGINITALTIETSKTTAELLYKSYQQAIVDTEAKKAVPPTQVSVQARLEVMRRKWDPLWEAYSNINLTYQQLVSIVDKPDFTEAEAMSVSDRLYNQQSRTAELLSQLREEMSQGP